MTARAHFQFSGIVFAVFLIAQSALGNVAGPPGHASSHDPVDAAFGQLRSSMHTADASGGANPPDAKPEEPEELEDKPPQIADGGGASNPPD